MTGSPCGPVLLLYALPSAAPSNPMSGRKLSLFTTLNQSTLAERVAITYRLKYELIHGPHRSGARLYARLQFENAHMAQDIVTESVATPSGTRRKFFAWITAAASGLIGLGLGIPLVGYVLGPAFKRKEQTWVDVGEAQHLTVEAPTQLNYVATARDGWMESKVEKAVWAVKQPGGDVTVFSPMCTHLGCGYRWDTEQKKFLCPCHGSVFGITGEVLGGPAPRPLDTLPVKVENGRLLVKYKEFRSGLSKKVEL